MVDSSNIVNGLIGASFFIVLGIGVLLFVIGGEIGAIPQYGQHALLPMFWKSSLIVFMSLCALGGFIFGFVMQESSPPL